METLQKSLIFENAEELREQKSLKNDIFCGD